MALDEGADMAALCAELAPGAGGARA